MSRTVLALLVKSLRGISPGRWEKAKVYQSALLAVVCIVTICFFGGEKGWAAPSDRQGGLEEQYLGIRGKTYRGVVRGVKVLEVLPDSPAAKAGLRSDRDLAPEYLRKFGGVAGHIIVRADGQPIHTKEDLHQFLARKSPDNVVKFVVASADGSSYEVITVTLGGTSPAPSQQAATEKKAANPSPQEETLGKGKAAETVPAVPLAEEQKGFSRSPSPEPSQPPSHLNLEGQDEEGLVSGLWDKAKIWLEKQQEWATRLSSRPSKPQEANPPKIDSAVVDPTEIDASPEGRDEKGLEANPSEVDSRAISAYLDMLEIQPIPKTSLVKVTFSVPDPELSARVANAHAQAYIRNGVKFRSHANEEALGFLQEKLLELKERVEKSEAILNHYRREQGIISLDDKENIVVERLADLNKRLTKAEAERIGFEAQDHLIRKRDYDSLPGVIDNPLIQTLKGELARLEGEQAQLSSQFKDRYPRVQQLKARVEETRRRLQKETQKAVGGITSAYLAAQAQEKELRVKMEEQKAAALGLKDASVEYAILAREVDTNRQLYESVLQRMKEMAVAAELHVSNVSVIDQAKPPIEASWPQKGLWLFWSACIGLVGGVGLAFFREYLDNTLKTPEEVVSYLRLPSLGVVPDFSSLDRRSYAPRGLPYTSFETPTIPSSGQELVLSHHPFSVVAEAYRTFRTAVLLSRAEEPPKTILFTSGRRGEGKTVTVINSAIIFSQMGARVLVIDADLRRPSCHKILDMENWRGLTELLTGHRGPQEVIRPTTIDHFSFLSSGFLPPNPTELVGSTKMREILTSLQEHYDYILIDSPPVMAVSDAVLLSTMVDGVIVVVDAQETPKPVVRKTCSRLSYAQAKILGVMLNRVNMRRGDYYYDYQVYYQGQ